MGLIAIIVKIHLIILALILCFICTPAAKAADLDIRQMTRAMIDNSLIGRQDSLQQNFDRAMADAAAKNDYILDSENFYFYIYLPGLEYAYADVAISSTAWKMNESTFLAAIVFEWGETMATYYSVQFFKFHNSLIPTMEEIHISEVLPVLTDADFCQPYIESEICLTPSQIAYKLPQYGTAIEAYINDLDMLDEEMMFPAGTSCYERLKNGGPVKLHWNGEKFIKAEYAE